MRRPRQREEGDKGMIPPRPENPDGPKTDYSSLPVNWTMSDLIERCGLNPPVPDDAHRRSENPKST